MRSGSGTRVWAVRPRQEGLLSAPVKAGKWLLISSEDVSLIVVDSTNGEIRQVFDPGKGSSAPAAVVGNRVFWVSNGETIFFFFFRQ
ncbi:MAG: hypothetical protein D6806_01770 [Deltaproteobacteria bacterium]|nr:MAG: hypothetical protein D6806_01770 [Deltaproteobacteria bacterium]